ncbi:MAG: hypothetical protein UX87_C0019G0006 [Candidatus Amesbacteria bacterium GW2011_GWA1_47_16]|uniref:N-acetyltransferase domain-containing protein n=1 Tax=Candidatus Amesbacteria bacterium GW2011_GWA1_47_16 TaxID=1618353 RepID=A0A0G1S2C5_9BACT|nr:MAG: hypothetical protein UX87_C0019G0006 [Candidatus Amesbacteria bacterium GW2011_GWA1_47_16]
MAGNTRELANFRSGEWRTAHMDLFLSSLAINSGKIAELLEMGPAENNHTEWYDPRIKNAYFIAGKTHIADALLTYSLIWNPLNGIVERNNFLLAEVLRNQGFGTQITLITEDFARSLEAHTLSISTIIEPRWYTKLLALGFKPDPEHFGAVMKKLK